MYPLYTEKYDVIPFNFKSWYDLVQSNIFKLFDISTIKNILVQDIYVNHFIDQLRELPWIIRAYDNFYLNSEIIDYKIANFFGIKPMYLFQNQIYDYVFYVSFQPYLNQSLNTFIPVLDVNYMSIKQLQELFSPKLFNYIKDPTSNNYFVSLIKYNQDQIYNYYINNVDSNEIEADDRFASTQRSQLLFDDELIDDLTSISDNQSVQSDNLSSQSVQSDDDLSNELSESMTSLYDNKYISDNTLEDDELYDI